MTHYAAALTGRILRKLKACPDMSVGELAKALEKPKGSVIEAMTRLYATGAVDRSGPRLRYRYRLPPDQARERPKDVLCDWQAETPERIRAL